MNLEQLGKFLIGAALVIAVMGVLIFVIGKGFGISKLPGDILIRRDNWRVFFPIATSIILSIILTIVLNVVVWLLKHR